MKNTKFFILLLILLFKINTNLTFGQLIKAGMVSGNDVYTDLVPDSIIQAQAVQYSPYHGGDIFLDIDKDNMFDFRFVAIGVGSNLSEGSNGYIYPLRNSCRILYNLDSTISYPSNTPCLYNAADTLELGDSLGSSLNFRSDTCYLWDYQATMGVGGIYMHLWSNIGDHFIGVSILTASDTLYGWIKINVQMQYYQWYTLTIKEFACNKNPDAIETVSESNQVTIFPIPADNFITINLPANIYNAELTTYSIEGNLLMKSSINRNSKMVNITSRTLKSHFYF